MVRGLLIAVASLVAEHRSEEHTSELQSRSDLVCRLLLEKKLAHLMHFFFKLFIYLFIFGCIRSSLLRAGFL